MADKKDTKTKRKGGGQPGNTNALKHGFYSRRFCDLELGDFVSSLGDDLQSEVAMLRAGQCPRQGIQIRRVFDLAAGIDDLEQAARLLKITAITVGRLASLLGVQPLYGLSTAGKLARPLASM